MTAPIAFGPLRATIIGAAPDFSIDLSHHEGQWPRAYRFLVRYNADAVSVGASVLGEIRAFDDAGARLLTGSTRQLVIGALRAAAAGTVGLVGEWIVAGQRRKATGRCS